jgi:hypothetical protein
MFDMITNNYYICLEDCEKHHHGHHHDCEQASGYFEELTISEDSHLITKIKGKLQIMALTMTDTQQASGTIAFVDKKGATTDAASVTITSSDESIATVSYDDPTNTVTVVAGLPGVATLTIDARQADGDELPFDDVAVEITASDAVSGTISFSAPTEQPEASTTTETTPESTTTETTA